MMIDPNEGFKSMSSFRMRLLSHTLSIVVGGDK